MIFLKRFSLDRLGLALLLPASLTLGLTASNLSADAVPSRVAQAAPAQPLTLRANSTEANAKTGVVVARGNVQINYPSRQIQATSAQAIYFSKERRIVLTGDVYVLQQGNSLRGENITYLVDEGRFIALPQASKQVEAIYLITDTPAVSSPSAAKSTPFSPSPQFQSPTSGKR
ncbi:ostA-like family protein [Phormidesmis priestleyi ULC007]|uniref:OstA-like family protein n=1 Tax=Phormidesmis priestleyi ULC007 TaxID=1920490 RepID=A0A2T1DFM3_9CYAN|nr:LptA/OstA family protein [Phormidesmis priestleyi]PSB19263.1 ostA-like family protein [Phormidesmis priestleyi ULC007]PZO52148.1 MAG: ostA-like family protein [Phormidesmis priestleyi]